MKTPPRIRIWTLSTAVLWLLLLAGVFARPSLVEPEQRVQIQLQQAEVEKRPVYTATRVVTRVRRSAAEDLLIDTQPPEIVTKSTLAYVEHFASGVKLVTTIASFNNGKALPPTGVPTSTPSFISTAEKKTSSAGIVGIAVGIPCFLLLGICIFLWVRRRHQKRERNSFIHLANSPKSSKNSTTTPTTTTNTSIRSSPYATTQTMTQSTNSSTRQNTHRTTSQNHSRNPSHHSQAPSTIRPDYNIPPPPRLMQRISRSFQRRSQVIDIHPGMPWSPHSYGPASPRSNPSIRPSPSPELRVRPPTPLAELETPATLAELESPISPLPLQVPQQVFVRPERERPNLAPLQIRSPSPGSSGDEFVSALSPVAAFGWGYQSELPEVVVVEEAEEHETDEERRLRETLEDTEARMEQLRMEQRRMEERRRRRQQGQ